MKTKLVELKSKCPGCGSGRLITIGVDQMCSACDWDNSRLLVNLGQMDLPHKAHRSLFSSEIKMTHDFSEPSVIQANSALELTA